MQFAAALGKALLGGCRDLAPIVLVIAVFQLLVLRQPFPEFASILIGLALVVVGLIVFGSGAWLRERIEMVTYFPGSVQGLDVGAQVQFQGVPVGQVTGISLDYLPSRESFRIPVQYEIWPNNVRATARMSARTGVPMVPG